MAQRLPPHERREQILDTATEMLAERGYRGLTMKAVATRCGLTAPAVSYHFKDMETLLFAVLRRRDAVDGREFFTDGDDRPLTAADFTTAVLKWMSTNPHAARFRAVMSIEAMDPSHPAHEACLQHNESIAAFLVSRLGDGYRDPERLARRLIAVLDGVQTVWLRHPEYIDVEESLLEIVAWVMDQHRRDPAGHELG